MSSSESESDTEPQEEVGPEEVEGAQDEAQEQENIFFYLFWSGGFIRIDLKKFHF